MINQYLHYSLLIDQYKHAISAMMVMDDAVYVGFAGMLFLILLIFIIKSIIE